VRGEFLPVWSETWRGIWLPLTKHRDAPTDIFSELYRALVPQPTPPSSPLPPAEFSEQGELVRLEDIDARTAYEGALSKFAVERARYEEAVSGDRNAKAAFRTAVSQRVKTESEAILALEMAFNVVDSYDVDTIRNRFFLLVDQFILKFSLRYDLRRPFTLHITPSGIYTKLYAVLVERCQRDAALAGLLRDYREAFQDLRLGVTSGRISTCLQKQVNLLEGLTSLNAAITATTLGQMCNEIKTWPSTAVCEAAKSLYGFASDHTGLRHGTIKKVKIGKTPTTYRDMEIRDLVAVSVFFTGLSAYLSDEIDSKKIYGA
jgi:hypothetical protein